MRSRGEGRQSVLWQVVGTRERLRRQVEHLLEENGYQVAHDALLPHEVRLNTIRAALVLTEAEQHVLEAWLDCDNRKQVAAALHISEDTVATHARNIFVKLGVHNRHRAIVEAIRAGVLEIKTREEGG